MKQITEMDLPAINKALSSVAEQPAELYKSIADAALFMAMLDDSGIEPAKNPIWACIDTLKVICDGLFGEIA